MNANAGSVTRCKATRFETGLNVRLSGVFHDHLHHFLEIKWCYICIVMSSEAKHSIHHGRRCFQHIAENRVSYPVSMTHFY